MHKHAKEQKPVEEAKYLVDLFAQTLEGMKLATTNDLELRCVDVAIMTYKRNKYPALYEHHLWEVMKQS